MISPVGLPRQDPRVIFEQQFMPEIISRSTMHFGHLDPEARQEAVQDCLAQSWATFKSAVDRGKQTIAGPDRRHRGSRACLGLITPATTALFANRTYDSGRRFSGSSNTDVMGERTRLNGRVNVVSIDDGPSHADGLDDCTLREVLADRRAENTPAELAAWNIDWGNFYRSDLLNDRQRVVLDLLASGYRTGEVAHSLGVSAPRAVQLTDALGDAVAQFFGPDIVPVGPPTGKPVKARGRQAGKKIYIPLNARANTAAD